MDQKVIDKFWLSTEKTNYCWNWKGFLDKSGLPVIRISTGIKNGKQSLKEYSPRQISKYLDGEDLSEKKHCLPTCGNKLCVNPDHLARGDEARFWAKVHKLNEPDGCWIWLAGEDKDGYGKFTININGKQITIRANRYAWFLYTGRLISNSRIFLCHKCDNPRCVNPEHLFPGNVQDNTDDCLAKKRNAFGEKGSSAKLTTDQVLEIRSLAKQGFGILQIQKRFDFIKSKSTIRAIVFGKTWKHLL